MSSIGQIEQGALNNEILDLLRKVFLKYAVVEIVYKFKNTFTTSVRKGKSTAKVPFKRFWGHIHTYIHNRKTIY